jgi:hypothetical protein
MTDRNQQLVMRADVLSMALTVVSWSSFDSPVCGRCHIAIKAASRCLCVSLPEFRTLFSTPLSLCTSLKVRDQVSHPHKTCGRIKVLYILTQWFSTRGLPNNSLWSANLFSINFYFTIKQFIEHREFNVETI